MQKFSIKDEFRIWGFKKFLYLQLMKTVRPLLVLCSVHVREISNLKDFGFEDDREARIASKEELLKVAKDPVYNMKESMINSALEKNDICVAIFKGDKIIAYAWWAFNATPHNRDMWVDFSHKYFYCYKGFTHPDFRRQSLQHGVQAFIKGFAEKNNFSHYLAVAETHNYPSIISDRKNGGVVVGYIGYLTLFGKYLTFNTNGAKKFGVKFTRAA